MDVAVGGVVVAENIDPFDIVGYQTPYFLTLDVTVETGNLLIIEIRRAAVGSADSPQVGARHPLVFNANSSQASVDNRLGAVYVSAVSSKNDIDGLNTPLCLARIAHG